MEKMKPGVLGKHEFWMSRKIKNEKVSFGVFRFSGFCCKGENQRVSNGYSSTSDISWIESLMEEIDSVLAAKKEMFDYRTRLVQKHILEVYDCQVSTVRNSTKQSFPSKSFHELNVCIFQTDGWHNGFCFAETWVWLSREFKIESFPLDFSNYHDSVAREENQWLFNWRPRLFVLIFRLDGGNRTCSGCEINVWISSEINTNNTFWNVSDCRDSFVSNTTKQICSSSCTSWLFIFFRLMEKVKPFVSGKNEFEFWEKLKLKAFLELSDCQYVDAKNTIRQSFQQWNF